MRQDLRLGLFNATVLGSGFTSLTVDLTADGQTLINQTFTSVAQVLAFFSNPDGKSNNQTIDLGNSLATGALSGNTLRLVATVTITTAKAGDGFYGGFIIGDPPGASQGPASRGQFVQAMAGLGGGIGGTALPISAALSPTQPMLAISRMAAIA